MTTSTLQHPITTLSELLSPTLLNSEIRDEIKEMNNVTKHSFERYAAANYSNMNCESIEEFNEDLQRFKYLKRLFNKYQETGELKDRLILNHIIVLYNVFDTHANTRMLFLKLKGFEHMLKPFLVFLNFMPDQITGVENKTIQSSDIRMDPNIVKDLRKKYHGS